MGENLGQHFLDNEEVLADIVAAGDVSRNDTILEVGPGEGALTEKLLAAGGQVIAVEKDPALVAKLKERFSEAITSNQLELTQADIRDISPADYGLKTGNYKLIANIPYYLTGQLLEQTLTSKLQPKIIVLLIQKEVAERIIAADGKESILSLSVKAYGRPEIIRFVSRNCFTPPPAVDSAVIKISGVNRDFFTDIDEDAFFRLIKRGFGHKRKKLSNNLATDPEIDKEQAEEALEKCDLHTNIRAERLSITEWKQVLKTL